MRPLEMNEPNNPIRTVVDAAAIAALAVLCASGAVLRTAEAPFSRVMGASVNPFAPLLFGLRTAEWSTLHDRAAVVLLFLLLPNLFWARGSFRWLFRRGERSGSAGRAAVGVIALLTLVSWFGSGIHRRMSGGSGYPEQATPLLGEESDGKLAALSLHEVEVQMGVPVEYMRVNLGLPTDVDATVPLSALMKKYSFTLREVRGVIFMHRMSNKVPMPSVSPMPRRPF